MYFPVNITKFLRTPLQNTFGQLLLKIYGITKVLCQSESIILNGQISFNPLNVSVALI